MNTPRSLVVGAYVPVEGLGNKEDYMALASYFHVVLALWTMKCGGVGWGGVKVEPRK